MSAISTRLPDVILANCTNVEGLQLLNHRYSMISTLVLNEFSKTTTTTDTRVLGRMYNMAAPDVRYRAVQAVYDRHFAPLRSGGGTHEKSKVVAPTPSFTLGSSKISSFKDLS